MLLGTETATLIDLTDEALVLACRENEDTAWEELIRRYQKLVLSIPRRAGLDEAVSADVFQYVFATLLDKLDQIKDPSRVRAWLITTAKRETWRVSKQYTQGTSIELDDQDINTLDLPDEKPLPEEVMQRLEELQFVQIALAEVGDPCRQLLEMLFYSSAPESYESISSIMRIPLGSIGPMRVRCLQKLRVALARLGYQVADE